MSKLNAKSLAEAIAAAAAQIAEDVRGNHAAYWSRVEAGDLERATEGIELSRPRSGKRRRAASSKNASRLVVAEARR